MSTPSTLGLNLTHSLPFNPATLPLLSTSLGLFYAIVEPTIFVPFLRSSSTHSKETNKSIQLWWTNFFNFGMATILSIGAANLAGGVYTLRSLQRGTQEWTVAAAGLGFALGHFAFGPKIAGVIKNLCDEEVAIKGETTTWLREWLRVHTWRTMLVDVPAVACFAWLGLAGQS